MTITRDQLDRLKQLEANATPPGWHPQANEGWGAFVLNINRSGGYIVDFGFGSQYDVAFIAALRNHARELIEAAKRMAELEEALANRLLGGNQ